MDKSNCTVIVGMLSNLDDDTLLAMPSAHFRCPNQKHPHMQSESIAVSNQLPGAPQSPSRCANEMGYIKRMAQR